MISSGIITCLMSDSKKEMIHDLIKGLGIFLLAFVGISDIKKRMRKK